MKFGPVPVEEAVGALAAHSVRAGDAVLKKGSVITAEQAERLKRAGVERIVAVRLEPGDVGEDQAAVRLAEAIAGPHVRVERPFTGRSNLFAESAGVLVIERDEIDRINAVDEAITAATLPAFKPVVAGEMIGTVKIIPYAVPERMLSRALAVVQEGQGGTVRVAPYARSRVAVVSTLLPGLKPTVVKKTLDVLATRLAPAEAGIVADRRVPHEAEALTKDLAELAASDADLIVVFGASAIADRRDVIPAAIEAAGGRVEHFGMPVDPGNLLLVGSLAGKPVIGAPGCARSPKENGFDWMLHRFLADIPVTRGDIASLGVGGLLMEIVTRPQPRSEPAPAPVRPRIGALILAAGRGTRMGGPNKLVAEVSAKPLVRHAVEAALASKAGPAVVVTGHEAGKVAAALVGLDVTLVHNQSYADGLSTSLRAGLAALGDDIDGVLVLLGDMPRVTADLLDKLIDAFDPAGGALAVVPVRNTHRGNPVLFSKVFFPELRTLTGDVGARGLLGSHGEAVVEVPVDDEAAFFDVDTPEALVEARSRA
ncbi:MAG TPA: molybdopterin-binding/glycosyltransferase family 2 protein [Beijerinckiaceae bacterium]|nr:molybdopterin-binding/glycosyltransferase family 2 protein [Beijerinckiaceae bacterium]